MVTRSEGRETTHEQHQGDTDHDQPRHDFVVLHRLAGMRSRRPRMVDRILGAFHRYSSLGIPVPALHGLMSTVELPECVVAETNVTGRTDSPGRATGRPDAP